MGEDEKPPQDQAPRDDRPRLVQYVDRMRSVWSLPPDMRKAHGPVLLEIICREAYMVCEQNAKLWAEVERLRPIAEAMKLVEQISDQRRQIAHLQDEVRKLTGIDDAAGKADNAARIKAEAGITDVLDMAGDIGRRNETLQKIMAP